MGVHGAAVAAIVSATCLLNGCVSLVAPSESPPASARTLEKAPPTPAPSAGETIPRSFVDGFPHQAPALEAQLPASVQGRPLTSWSVIGEEILDVLGASSFERETLRSDLSRLGAVMDDFAYGVAGRSNTATDPPYFVFGLAIDGVDTSDIPREFMVSGAGPDTSWAEATLAGKQVRVGGSDLIDQDEHIRGDIYVYDTPDVRFIIVTDDVAWAEDALSQLP